MNIVTLFMLNKKVISLDFKFGGPTRLFLLLKNSEKLVDESGGASPWNHNPFVHHQKIRFVDFWGF